MRVDELQWDARNIEHLERHRVDVEEAEEVCFGSHFARKVSATRYIVSGQTSSGRYLCIIIERLDGSFFRPITAYEMNDQHKNRYRKRGL